MRSILRAAVLAVSMFALGWAIPGCGSDKGGETGKMEGGAMGKMESGKMESGKMESGKMEGEKK
ncbi:MAG: hypothetical protein JO116_18270 [Planctomycetaceae bacterium]|nr:hypothetical protein [Planctomycetaceae bacterium]